MWQALLILCPTQWSEHFPKTCSARRVWRHCSSSHSPQVMWSTGELTAKVKSCGGWLYVVSMSSLWEEAMGCSVPDTDGSSWSQLAPTDPLQDTAEPISQAGGISRKTHFKKEQNHCILVWGVREKSRRKDPVNSRGQRRSCWSGRAGLTHLSHGQLPATHLAVHSFSLLDSLRGGNRKGQDKDWNQLCLAWGNPRLLLREATLQPSLPAPGHRQPVQVIKKYNLQVLRWEQPRRSLTDILLGEHWARKGRNPNFTLYSWTVSSVYPVLTTLTVKASRSQTEGFIKQNALTTQLQSHLSPAYWKQNIFWSRYALYRFVLQILFCISKTCFTTLLLWE